MQQFGRSVLGEWLLDPEVVYLNHGTVGATPRRVLNKQRELREQIERNPSLFLLRELAFPLAGGPAAGEPHVRRAAREVAEFVGARGEDLVFTDNATSAINAVLRSFELRAGDEILVFEHGYGAIHNTAEFIAARAGAHVRRVSFPYPEVTEAAVVRALEAALTCHTRLAILDHVTSPSALVLPLAQLSAVCRARGVPVLADGAHSVGAIPLDIPALGVDWYTSNLHKWCWAPRSSAFLWVAPAHRAALHPTTISWGLGSGMIQEFDWVGTYDPTRYLAAPAAIAWMRELGVERVQRYNHELAWQAGRMLSAAWKTALPVPESMVGTMVNVRLPDGAGATQEQADALRYKLLFEDNIEVQLKALQGAVWARVSAQIYNEARDIERLAEAVLQRV